MSVLQVIMKVRVVLTLVFDCEGKNMRRLVVYVGIMLISLLISGCGTDGKEIPQNDGKSELELSFDSDEPLVIEENQLFGLTVNIAKLKMSEIERTHRAAKVMDGKYDSPSLELSIKLMRADSDDDYDNRIGASLYRAFRVSGCFIGDYGLSTYVEEKENSKAEFSDIYLDRYADSDTIKCGSGCLLSVSLSIRHGCGGGGACRDTT